MSASITPCHLRLDPDTGLLLSRYRQTYLEVITNSPEIS